MKSGLLRDYNYHLVGGAVTTVSGALVFSIEQ